MTPGVDVKKVLDRIKNLEEFIVPIELPEIVMWKGYIPFEMTVEGRDAMAVVLAESQDEADQKVIDFFGATVEYRSLDEDEDEDDE